MNGRSDACARFVLWFTYPLSDSKLKRIVLGIQYDGSPWKGWQTQPHGNTVQDRLEAALKKFTHTEIATTCAGRTDAGVHAIEQVVHFDCEIEREPFSWVRGTNAFLPPSIAVRWARVLDEKNHTDFHARFSARSRTYHYVLYSHPVRSPLLEGKAGWVFRPLDLGAMETAAEFLLGEHDFSAFRAAECQARTPIKTMHEIKIVRRGDLLVFTLRANAFLHHMVRNIMGALVYVGTGVHHPQWLGELLAQRNRSLAAPTFMPDGLYLARIDYDLTWRLPQEEAILSWLG
jgi:tRNA pseudouridine38-40 synthase